MLFSHEWLRTIVPHAHTANEIAELIGRHVATIDDVRQLRQDLAPIVVARVVQVARHPNADSLWVTRVDDGSGEVQDVVCGAPNVVEGTLYPFARVGTVMPTGNKGGILIERRKIRGEWSSGMLCSARELGIGEEYDGILPLDVDVPTGTPLLEALPLSDVCFDVDVLPNRPDLLSHRGMAREVAGLTGAPLRTPSDLIAAETGVEAAAPVPEPIADARQASSGGATVRLEDPDGCPRYMAVVIRGVTVGASPAWLVTRLEAVGSRSISNVVDATNYILHALGQPMHAFDLGTLAASTVVVRRARTGEKLVTLDGVERSLDPSMTVIADAERTIAVAGVMGGRDSEVTAETTAILLEVAYFDPRSVRKARRALGLSTDASHRFERGVDPEATREALVAATQLILAIAGGRVDGAPLDVGAVPAAPARVTLKPERAGRLLGAAVTSDEIVRMLRSVGFGVDVVDPARLEVSPPSWRNDVARDADLVEEIARLRGFDTLSDELSPSRAGTVPDHPFVGVTRALREVLAGEGLLEVRPMPFVKADDATHVRVSNPLAEDEPHLRSSILETLARRAEYNLGRMEGNLRLFEIGAVFAPDAGPLPRETIQAGALVMGLRRPPHFTDPKPPAWDVWDVRALGERMARQLHGPEIALVPGDGDLLWTIVKGYVTLGRILRLAIDRPVWAHEAFGVEILVGPMENADVAPRGAHATEEPPAPPVRAHPRFRPLPSTPAAEVDLALVLPPALTAASVERVIRESAGALLEHLTLFDEYRGAGLPEGHRSVAWRLTFRDPTRTLRDKEVEGRRSKILQTLEKDLGIRTRTG
ncbi:MAG: phenylalanine--tRNA ligase subunit beta [Gemmatimonadaceae bacterium]